jgi:phage FluMu protein gp41
MKTSPTNEQKKHTPGAGTLKYGLKVGDTVHRDFALREATTDDLIAAEEEAGPEKQIAFNAALIAIQLVRIGTFEGPFTPSMIRALKASDFWKLRTAQVELEAAGES